VLVADEVDAGDLDPHAVGGVDAGRLPVEVLARGDGVIEYDEWSRIEKGVQQRVRALEAFLDDAYGHQPAKSNVTPCARYELARDSVRPRSSSCVIFARA
jgi:hypothetical protein